MKISLCSNMEEGISPEPRAMLKDAFLQFVSTALLAAQVFLLQNRGKLPISNVRLGTEALTQSAV